MKQSRRNEKKSKKLVHFIVWWNLLSYNMAYISFIGKKGIREIDNALWKKVKYTWDTANNDFVHFFFTVSTKPSQSLSVCSFCPNNNHQPFRKRMPKMCQSHVILLIFTIYLNFSTISLKHLSLALCPVTNSTHGCFSHSSGENPAIRRVI